MHASILETLDHRQNVQSQFKLALYLVIAVSCELQQSEVVNKPSPFSVINHFSANV